MVRSGLRIGVLVLVGLLAFGAGGCGKKKKKDPIVTALETPGIRTVVIQRQRSDVAVVVPPCTAAAIEQTGARRRPPGSNEIVVPAGTLTQTVAIPPCPEDPKQAVANTVVVTPGGTGGTQELETPPQHELVLPRNSNVATIIVPPCVLTESKKKKKSGGAEGTASLTLPAEGRNRTVTAPPCMAQAKKKK
ncbi:MAG TPA: hypothetical protein VG474_17470 [Solirubrobacteraceae bacterium]|nr:hypothetical protein [Solirubrobacteraceae bacterium]